MTAVINKAGAQWATTVDSEAIKDELILDLKREIGHQEFLTRYVVDSFDKAKGSYSGGAYVFGLKIVDIAGKTVNESLPDIGKPIVDVPSHGDSDAFAIRGLQPRSQKINKKPKKAFTYPKTVTISGLIVGLTIGNLFGGIGSIIGGIVGAFYGHILESKSK